MKIIKILSICFCIIIMLSHNSLAISETISTADKWISTGYNHAGIGLDTDQLKDVSDEIYNILLVIATVVAVIVGAILGIKFMTAGINEKVEVKKSLFPYFISCVVVFGSLGIWKLVVTLLKSF